MVWPLLLPQRCLGLTVWFTWAPWISLASSPMCCACVCSAQKFAPAAGDRLQLTLWACTSCPQGNAVAEIQNVRSGDVLKLRAADGSPLFAGPRGGRGMHGPGGSGGYGMHDGTGPNPNCPNRTRG